MTPTQFVGLIFLGNEVQNSEKKKLEAVLLNQIEGHMPNLSEKMTKKSLSIVLA